MIFYISNDESGLRERFNSENEPSALASAILRQFVRCSYSEKRLLFPEKLIFMN